MSQEDLRFDPYAQPHPNCVSLGTSYLTEMPQPVPQLSCPSNGSDNCCLKELCEPQQKSGTWTCSALSEAALSHVSNAVAMSRAVLCLVTSMLTTPWSGSYDPMDCSPSGSLPLGILRAGILEWIAALLQDLPNQDRSWSPTIRQVLYLLSHQKPVAMSNTGLLTVKLIK